MKRWDAFISHASEDKDAVALPLVEALEKAGLQIWLDRSELRIGDSLREKIDEGLAHSRFGIVILSTNFLSKRWPQRELNGLMTLEEGGQKVILPVWHQIEKSTLAQFSPLLADRLAGDTSRGIENLAADLIRVILDPDSGSPSATSPSIRARLFNLLENNPDTASIKAFLTAHPEIIRRATAVDRSAVLKWSASIGAPASLNNLMPDLWVGKLWRTRGRLSWSCYVFESPSQRLFVARMEPRKFLAQALERVSTFREWVLRRPEESRTLLPNINPEFYGTVVASRRDQKDSEETRQLGEFNDSLVGVRIRTYDWLIESAASGEQ